MQSSQDNATQANVPCEAFQGELEKNRILKQAMSTNYELHRKVVRQNREMRRVQESIDAISDTLTKLLPAVHGDTSKKTLMHCIRSLKADLE